MKPKFKINQKVFIHPEIEESRALQQATIKEIMTSRISGDIFYLVVFPATEQQEEMEIAVNQKYVSKNHTFKLFL